MKNPIANLGDYNIARDALKAFGGNWKALYDSIGKDAVAKASARLQKGVLKVIIALLVALGLYKGGRFCWNKISKNKNSVELKAKFLKTIKCALSQNDGKVIAISTDRTDNNGVVYKSGDIFNIVSEDGDYIVIEKVGNESERYIVSVDFLKGISDLGQ